MNVLEIEAQEDRYVTDTRVNQKGQRVERRGACIERAGTCLADN